MTPAAARHTGVVAGHTAQGPLSPSVATVAPAAHIRGGYRTPLHPHSPLSRRRQPPLPSQPVFLSNTSTTPRERQRRRRSSVPRQRVPVARRGKALKTHTSPVAGGDAEQQRKGQASEEENDSSEPTAPPTPSNEEKESEDGRHTGARRAYRTGTPWSAILPRSTDGGGLENFRR